MRTTAIAGALFACLFVLQVDPLAGILDGLGGGVGTGNLLVVVPTVVLTLAGAHAARYDGLLVCLAVAHLVVLAWSLPIAVWGLAGVETGVASLFGTFVGTSVLLGGVGYGLGRTVAAVASRTSVGGEGSPE